MYFVFYVNKDRRLYSGVIPDEVRRWDEAIITTPHIYSACSAFFRHTVLPVYIYNPDNTSVTLDNEEVMQIKDFSILRNTRCYYSIMGDRNLLAEAFRLAEDVEVVEVSVKQEKMKKLQRTPYIADLDRDNQYDINEIRKFTYKKVLYTIKNYTKH